MTTPTPTRFTRTSTIAHLDECSLAEAGLNYKEGGHRTSEGGRTSQMDFNRRMVDWVFMRAGFPKEMLVEEFNTLSAEFGKK